MKLCMFGEWAKESGAPRGRPERAGVRGVPEPEGARDGAGLAESALKCTAILVLSVQRY